VRDFNSSDEAGRRYSGIAQGSKKPMAQKGTRHGLLNGSDVNKLSIKVKLAKGGKAY
jgi:hypothetical protein